MIWYPKSGAESAARGDQKRSAKEGDSSKSGRTSGPGLVVKDRELLNDEDVHGVGSCEQKRRAKRRGELATSSCFVFVFLSSLPLDSPNIPTLAMMVMSMCSFSLKGPGLRVALYPKRRKVFLGRTFSRNFPAGYERS
jgi:hypothetical protein